ncbi:MAG: hypothetical protein R6V27_06115 [Balneolaceae bacterium]
MLLEPMNEWYIKELSRVRRDSPALEYEIIVTGGGAAGVIN